MNAETSDQQPESFDEVFEATLAPPRARQAPLHRPAPLRPMVFAALVLIAGIVVGRILPMPGWCVVAGMISILAFSLAGLWLRRGSPEGRLPMHTGFLLFGVIFLFGAWRGGRISFQDRFADLMVNALEGEESLRVEGVVSSPPQLREYGWRVVLRDVLIFSGAESEFGNVFPLKLQALVFSEDDLKPSGAPPCNQGERVAFLGRLKSPGGASFPGDFDERIYLGSHGIGAKLNVRGVGSVEVLETMNLRAKVYASIRSVRSHIDSALATFIGDASHAGLASALLIGERTGISPVLNEAFARTGLVHILSVSGYHTGIVLLFILGLLRIFGFGPRATVFLSFAGLAFYAALTGFDPPVVRAAFMSAFMLGGWALGRHTSLLSGLAVSAFLTLVFDPRNLQRPDWQLSYLCVLSITAFVPAIYELALPMTRPATQDDPSRWERFFKQQIWLPFVVVLAVQIGMLPIQIHYFGRISVVGFVVQPVAIVLVIISMALSALVSLFAWLPPVAIAVGLAAKANIAVFEWLVLWAGSWEWSVLELPHMPGWMTGLYLATLFFGSHLLKGRASMSRLDFHQRRNLVWRLGLVLLFVAGLVWMPQTSGARGVLDLYVVDVGQGDAIVLCFPDGRMGLIDGGRGGLSRMNDSDIVRFLHSLGVRRLDFVVATHADADHIGGLPGVIKQFVIGRFIHGPDRSSSELARELGRELAIAPYPVTPIVAGETIEGFEPVGIEALNPLPGTDNNDASVTLLVDFDAVEILLTGDIESATERRIVESGRARDIEVLKVPHHGSSSSTTNEFLDAFKPEFALISVGRKNVYRHPSASVLQRLAERGIATARTDEMGTLLLRTNGREIRLYRYGPME